MVVPDVDGVGLAGGQTQPEVLLACGVDVEDAVNTTGGVVPQKAAMEAVSRMVEVVPNTVPLQPEVSKTRVILHGLSSCLNETLS